MNLSPAWVSLLAEAGFDAHHWSTVGLANALDVVLFSWARKNDAVVFTHDLDFGALLALTGAEAPSVFQVRTQDISPRALGPRVVELLCRFNTELDNGALIIVDESRERVRLLPLSR